MNSKIERIPSTTNKFEVFISDSTDRNGEGLDKGKHESGHTFIGRTGPFDCSIGNIFRADFMNPGSFTIDSTATRRRGKALSVLIVDDSVIHRKITMKTLGGLIDEVMWMCDSAENGESAIKLVQNSVKIPDVIIIDQNMESTGGRMLGHQVVELLRQDSRFDNVVIIGCTGMSELAHRDLLGAGCDAVWSKPMPSREEAQAQIVRFLTQKRNQLVEQQLSQNITCGIQHDQKQPESVYTCNPTTSPGNSVLPVFQQVKIARIAYKPLPWEAVVDRSYDRQRALLLSRPPLDSPRAEDNDELKRLEQSSATGEGGVRSVVRGVDKLVLDDRAAAGADGEQEDRSGPESELSIRSRPESGLTSAYTERN